MLGTAVAQINADMGQFTSKVTSIANRYEGTSACPTGQEATRRGSTYHAAKYIGGPTSTPWVECKPIVAPVAAPAPVVAGPTYTTTISPVLQTEISPMISPVFAQMQDSPGAVQAGTPTMIAPGGMEAEGGGAGGGAAPADGTTAMLEFMRLQSEQESARRAEETAAREAERREQTTRDTAFQQAQLDFQREQARLQQERQAAIDAGDAERAAQLEAQYQAAQSEWEKTRATPGGFVATSIMPGRQMVGPEVPAPGPIPRTGAGALPVPVMIAAGLAVLVGGYFLATKGKG